MLDPAATLTTADEDVKLDTGGPLQAIELDVTSEMYYLREKYVRNGSSSLLTF